MTGNPTKPLNQGETYHRWTVIGPCYVLEERTYATCRCQCGAVHDVLATSVRRGTSQQCRSCCSKHRFTKHGESRLGAPEYRAWQSMIQRCTNPRNKRWK